MPSEELAELPLRLRLVGDFQLWHGPGAVPVPTPARRLLAYLALQNRPVSRRTVAGVLWDAGTEQQAAARLRSTLWRLPAPGGAALVDIDGGRLQLSPAVEVDVHLARDEQHTGDLDLDHLCGDVLADWTEEWVFVERERFRQLRLHRLEQLSELARHRGSFYRALQAALAAVAADPLRESAHRQVMLAHLAEQNPSEALRQYHFARAVLRDELGIAPAPATRAVVAALLGRPLDLRNAS
jgi:DNA-binding SARP family transcriptional activator